MEQDNSDLLPHYYPFWNHWWYIIECFLEKQNLWRIVWYTPSVLSMTELTVWHIIIIIIIFINHYTVCTIHFDSCSRKESFLINWIHHSDLRRGHLVSSFIDILMRDAGVASTIKHSACMDNRADWAARRLAPLRPPEWMTIITDEIWFCSQRTWRTGNITAGKLIPKIVIIITVTWW